MRHPLLERQRTSLNNTLRQNRERLGSAAVTEVPRNDRANTTSAPPTESRESPPGPAPNPPAVETTPPAESKPSATSSSPVETTPSTESERSATSSLDFSLRAQEVLPSITVDGQRYQGSVGLLTDEANLGAERARMTESALRTNQRAYEGGSASHLAVVYDKTFRFGDDVRTRPVEFRGPPEAILQQVDSGEIPASALAQVGLSRQVRRWRLSSSQVR